MNNAARLQESLLDVLGCLSRCLHEDQTVLTRKHLTLARADLPARVQIALVSNQHDGHVRVAVLAHLVQPFRQMRVRVPPSDIIH